MFGAERVPWFNGGLFDSDDVLELRREPEIGTLLEVGRLDWSLIEPAIFGTLFERGLDPDRRAQLGAHYTAREQIWQLVEPVVIRPLRREYAAMQARVTELLLSGRKVTKATAAEGEPDGRCSGPSSTACARCACSTPPAARATSCTSRSRRSRTSSGRRSSGAPSSCASPQQFPQVGPEAVHGHRDQRLRGRAGPGDDLDRRDPVDARATASRYRRDPILRPLDNIESRDALLDLTDPTHPREAEWPEAEFIVGNPPFLGGKLLRRGLGDDYVERSSPSSTAGFPGWPTSCAYWHEKARAQIAAGRTRRAGLLATQGIRGGANRRVLGANHRVRRDLLRSVG